MLNGPITVAIVCITLTHIFICGEVLIQLCSRLRHRVAPLCVGYSMEQS